MVFYLSTLISSEWVSGCNFSCSFRLQVITSLMQPATDPIVYPSDIFAIAPVSNLLLIPMCSLKIYYIKMTH